MTERPLASVTRIPRQPYPVDDGLGAARGCLFAMVLSVPLWTVIGVVVWLIRRWVG